MSISWIDNRELRLEVKLSAIGMTDIGTAGGNFASFSSVPDAQNTRNLNFDNNYNNPFIQFGSNYADFKIGRKVKQIPSVQNGYILEVNTTPSASSCTFAYGGIQYYENGLVNSATNPGRGTHPVFNLLYGPVGINYLTYKVATPQTDTTKPQINSSDLRPPDIQENGFLDKTNIANKKPFVPFIRYERNTTLYPTKNLSNTVRELFQRYRTTWNIWNLYASETSQDPLTNKVVFFEGPSLGANDPILKTVRDGENGAKCFVSTIGKNKKTFIRRVFPVSKDSMFFDRNSPNFTSVQTPDLYITNDPPEIFFPTKIKTLTNQVQPGCELWREQVLTRPINNCGFHLNLSNLNVSSEDSFIKIIYENFSVNSIKDFNTNTVVKNIPNNTIYRIEIELNSNSLPKVTIKYRLNNTNYEKIFTQLRAPVFDGKPNTVVEYDIFVHFSGPIMMLGFTPDTSLWNSITPDEIITGQQNQQIDFNFPQDTSFISMETQNSSYVFKYSTIVFDNFNFDKKLLDYFGNDTNPNLIWDEHEFTYNPAYFAIPNFTSNFYVLNVKNHILSNFKISSDYRFDLNIQTRLNNNVFGNYTTNFVKNTLPQKSPISYFPDWRNTNDINNDPVFRLNYTYSDYKQPTLRLEGVYTNNILYKSLFNSTLSSYPNFSSLRSQNIYEEWGKILFNGTIEGPVFLSSFIDKDTTATAPDDVKFLKDIEKGDITSYVSNIRIDCNAEHTNKSFIDNSAVITLENLDSSEEGWKILELIENNVIVVTVNAGYGQDLKKYFQGAIKSISTQRTGSQSKTTLTCQDLSSYLLENIYFEKTISFASLRLGDIIRVIMNASGFSLFYNDLIDLNDAPNFLNNEAYIQRLSTNPAINQDLLLATQFDRIKSKLDIFLPKMCKVGQQVVFRWEPGVYAVDYGTNNFGSVVRKTLNGFVFDNRYAPHNRDVGFKFIGIENDPETSQLFISARPDTLDKLGWHGLIIDDFTITTNTKPLAYRVETAGYNLLQGMFSANTDNDSNFNSAERISPKKLDQITKALVSNTNIPVKYVGFRKQIKDISDRVELPSESIMKFKHAQNALIASRPFHTISFECYVTQPLKFWGTFYIDFYNTDGVITDPPSETYMYSRLSYTIDKKSNLITANVEGVRLPWTITGLEETSQ